MGFVPTRYPGSSDAEDAALKLARRTEWVDAGSETFVGLGQRLLATDAGDTAIMDLRSLKIEPAAGSGDG